MIQMTTVKVTAKKHTLGGRTLKRIDHTQSMRKRRASLNTRRKPPIRWTMEPVQDIVACHHPDLGKWLEDAIIADITK